MGNPFDTKELHPQFGSPWAHQKCPRLGQIPKTIELFDILYLGSGDQRSLIHVVEKFPFRIQTTRTDRGHEFQALFHWHVADLGMEHVYIKPRTPQLNGKAERFIQTLLREWAYLRPYRSSNQRRKHLEPWLRYYNRERPHSALGGKPPIRRIRRNR